MNNDDQISALFEGRTEPQNDTIAYFVEQAKNAHAEHQAVMANLELGQRQMEAYRCRRIELEALQQKYIADLEFWLKKEQDAAEQKPQLEVIDGESEPGSDQHGDEGPKPPERMAPGVGSEMDDVPDEGSG